MRRFERKSMMSCRWAALTVSVLLVCLTGSRGLAAAQGGQMQSVGTAASSVDAGKLLRTSMSIMKRRLHSVHASGVLQNGACCPRVSAQARLKGDCTTNSTAFALRFAEEGKTLQGKTAVTVDSRFIISPTTGKTGPWKRSLATHNLWQVDSSPTKDMDIAFYVCPMVAMAQFTAHFPAHLVNLGAVIIDGVSAWHLRDKLAATSGGFRGTVTQIDFYLAQASSYWIRFGYLYDDGSTRQYALEDYSKFNIPVRIVAPTIGSSKP
jgi:hypothetical protein